MGVAGVYEGVDGVMRVEKTGFSDSRRIVDGNGTVIAMIMRYTSGFWAVHDMSDKKVSQAIFKTPNFALKWYIGHLSK